MTALIVALIITTCAAGMCAYFAYAARRHADSAAHAAQRWREAAQSRARNGLGETEVFTAVTAESESDDVDAETGWTETEQLLAEK